MMSSGPDAVEQRFGGILQAVGKTPLVPLRKLATARGIALFAKLEMLNPGGSAKDRSALLMLKQAWETGRIGPGSVVVESSSGNMGIGLAQVCRYLGLRFVCVVDPRTAPQNLQLLEAYGARIDLVEKPDPESGEFLQARLRRVEFLLRAVPGAFWPDQYSNRANALAHARTTIREILDQVGGRLDYLFCATSTCGTVTGCASYLREHGLPTRVVAVDAVGSILFAEAAGRRLIPGLGAGVRPDLCRPDLVDRVVHVSDLDCTRGCRQLLATEAIMAGGSSGGVIAALEKIRSELQRGAVCAVILPDRGERYLDTVYSDQWVAEKLGVDLSRTEQTV